jgi:lactoylglutathione lyase
MYISVVTLPVYDLDRAIDFYTKGLGWEKTMDAPMGEGERWVTVAPKGGQASFTLSVVDETVEAPENDVRVIFEVDDVYSTCDQLQAKGVTVTQAPSTEPWGGWAMIKDSEGNVHGLHSPAAVAARNN